METASLKEKNKLNSARLKVEVENITRYKYIYINTSSLKKTLSYGPANASMDLSLSFFLSLSPCELSLLPFVIVVQNEQLIVVDVTSASL